MTVANQNPFRIPLTPTWLARGIEKVLGLTALAKHYDTRPEQATPEQFLDYTLTSLDCSVSLQGQPLEQAIPESGPTIVVANHPFGGIEGVALTRALIAVRPDIKVLTNQMLSRIPELSPIFFGVDVLGEKTAHRNTASVRAATHHLENGGALLVFPAGQVSAISWRRWQIRDRKWNAMVGRLAQRVKAHCVPVFIHGSNPTYFQIGGLIHRRIRTLLLPRQLSNKSGKTISMTVGETLKPKDFNRLDSAAAVTDLLRISTYLLARKNQSSRIPLQQNNQQAEHLESSSHQALRDELTRLAPYKLLTKANFDVYCAPFEKLDKVFTALAREREITFRAAGEGTGKELDTDQFDAHYQHLFVWDNQKQAIVGGYRLGETDVITKSKGVAGLYSRSLYKYDERYLQKLGPALEVGRSFVTQAYQRHPAALDLLWRGIGHYIVKNPKYTTLFGCVSISSDHSEQARAFISDAMMESFKAEQKFLENVKPLVPLKVKGKVWSTKMLRSIRDISVFNKLVGQCDPGKTIPVLLRHYLALNGRFVGFSVNKGFNDSLDGLIIADLKNMPERYLSRYLGKTGLESIKLYWKEHDSHLLSEH